MIGLARAALLLAGALGSAVASPAAAAGGAPTAAGSLDLCSLLTREEVAAVQGEPVRETRLHRRTAAGVVRLSCFYTLPTFSRSVSLELAVADAAAGAPTMARALWRERFGSEAAVSAAAAAEGEAAPAAETDESAKEGEETGPPLAVAGVGEGGFWVGSHLSGALYVLQGDALLRVSIGGSEGSAERVDRATRLARAVLVRLARLQHGR